MNVSHSAAIAFQLGGVPAATGDSISLTASLTGGGTCQGSASGINITAAGKTTVTVLMLCSLPWLRMEALRQRHCELLRHLDLAVEHQ